MSAKATHLVCSIRDFYVYFRYVYMQGVLTGARAYFIMQQNS